MKFIGSEMAVIARINPPSNSRTNDPKHNV
jgi:hypothetical protein